MTIRGLLTHPEREPAPSRPAQKRDDGTHRLATDRGPETGTTPMTGLRVKRRGKRLAHDTGIAWMRIEEAKGLPLQGGGKERVRAIACACR